MTLSTLSLYCMLLRTACPRSIPFPTGRACIHTNFYSNRQLELYASKEAKRLSLRQLIFYGRSMNEERLVKSANYVRTELPVRLAHRITDLQALPFIVATEPNVERVYNLYWSAFEKIRRFPVIYTLADNNKFCEFLHGILDEHVAAIPTLGLGLSLSSRHLKPEDLDNFMRRMLISRISRRVLAEHHLALSEAHAGRQRDDPQAHVGIIFTDLNVKWSIEKCVSLLRSRQWEDGLDSPPHWPDVVIDGHVDTKFAYIREHLEYMVLELLKNAMRATIIKHKTSKSLPPIRLTIVSSAEHISIRISDQGGGLSDTEGIKSASDLFSFSHLRNSVRLEDFRLDALRNAISSSRGIQGTVAEQLESQLPRNETPQASTVMVPQTRIGLGLPMSNIYATYFGGSLDLVSLDSWGTDVYLRLPKLGTNLEWVEV